MKIAGFVIGAFGAGLLAAGIYVIVWSPFDRAGLFFVYPGLFLLVWAKNCFDDDA